MANDSFAHDDSSSSDATDSIESIVRADGRAVDELRPVTITRHFTDAPEGSVLITCGNTRVMCTATFTPGVPRWRQDSGLGWVTAEYAMLPRATAERTDRESVKGKVGGRTHEISRLIGRCLRGVVDMRALGENQVQMDCDVLQADGGTRTASVTGAYVALVDAMRWAEAHGHIESADKVLKDVVSAVSVGVIDGTPMLDLPYPEDSRAMTDMNVAMTGSGTFIEIQGTAEHRPFNRAELNTLLDLAEKGNRELQAAQRAALAEG
ncbi:ribonuclease PH [Bifidobacterium jacchi]|uniref:ribonuclease PH n=1 Tax=Bifidobacterium jacchi TaxID=2490545 RepID=UPI001F4F58B6|nr:ribonuclease PH [Bifidobacterium jacchi]